MISLPAGSEFVVSAGVDAGSDAGAGVVSGSLQAQDYFEQAVHLFQQFLR